MEIDSLIVATAGERPAEETETPTDSPTEIKPEDATEQDVITADEPEATTHVDNTEEEKERKHQERFDRRWKQREEKLRDELRSQFQEELQRERDAILERVQPKSEQELADWYKELFGDDPAVRGNYAKFEAWQKQREKQLEDNLLKRIRDEQLQAQEAVTTWESKIENQLASLESVTHESFTGESAEAKRNRAELLKVVQEYTPKDDKGNFATDFIPFDKAYEIVKLKRSIQKEPQRQAQRQAATRTAQDTHGGGSPARPLGTIGSFFNRDVSEFYSN